MIRFHRYASATGECLLVGPRGTLHSETAPPSNFDAPRPDPFPWSDMLAQVRHTTYDTSLFRHHFRDQLGNRNELDRIACEFCPHPPSTPFRRGANGRIQSGVCLITFVAENHSRIPGPDLWEWIRECYFEEFECSAHLRAQFYVDDAALGVGVFLSDKGWFRHRRLAGTDAAGVDLEKAW